MNFPKEFCDVAKVMIIPSLEDFSQIVFYYELNMKLKKI
jgi:hypothetical protein